MELIKRYQKWTTEPTRRYTRELRSALNSENVFAEWYACNNWPTKSELRFMSAESKPGKSELSAHKAAVEDCPVCDSCGIELGEDVGYYGPGMKWIDASVALYPWRGEYYCDGCLDEEFAMLQRDVEDGSVTVFFGADEMDMPDELVIIADEQEG